MLLKNFYEIYRNISTACNLKDVTGTVRTSKTMHFLGASTQGGISYRAIGTTSSSSSTIYGFNQLGILYGNIPSGNPEAVRNFTYMGMGIIGVGTDDTPVTYEDYKLGSIIVLPQTNYNIINIVENGEHIGLGYTVNINNNTGADVDIKEVGIYSGAASDAGYPYLIYREVLETPITIPNGQSIVVTMRLM